MITKQELNDLGFLKHINRDFVSFGKDGWYIWAAQTEKPDVYTHVSLRQQPLPEKYANRPATAFTDFSHINDLKEAIERHENIEKVEKLYALPSNNHGWNEYNHELFHPPSESC
jgi:hypothetical protein